MKFRELLSISALPFDCGKGADPDIRHICCDSRVARMDSIFVCIVGAVTDGHLFARSAYNLGCRAFVAEHEIDLPADATMAYTDNSRIALAALSNAVYDSPSRRLKVIGITGTKGKTTTALMIKEILNKSGIPTGYIGSNGVEYANFKHRTVNTTPESCDLQRYFSEMYKNGIHYVTLEISSQALFCGRVRNIEFDTCVFTNLSPDHIGLNEHPDFEHYKASKASLFSEYKMNCAIVNADDPHTPDMIRHCRAELDFFGINSAASHTAENIRPFKSGGRLGVSFDYIGKDTRMSTSLSFPGECNIMNALAATAVCSRIIRDEEKIISALPDIMVDGRFTLVDALPYATVVIDYAHNGISLRAVLQTLRSYSPRRLITLFGSVGGRTQMRRAELGAVASELSDFCILTADNPDNEDPSLIIRDIAAAFVPGGCEYIAIPDRREAIRRAIEMLREGDILLLAGKGHEDYQLIKGMKILFCEREIVMEAAEQLLRTMV